MAMPIRSEGWEMHIVRERVQEHGDGRERTLGHYQVYHGGVRQNGPDMSGMVAEAKGPGANRPENNGLRIDAGRYPLYTQRGGEYVTWKYAESENPDDGPKPGFELKNTGERTEILVHPGRGFLRSVGCINPCTSLPDANEMITYASSRRRVISLIEDMKSYIGEGFPRENGERIPGAFVVIDREP
jgi:hypothetical protein